MEIISISIGIIGLLITVATLYRTKKNQDTIRILLAKLSGEVTAVKQNAQWANSHFDRIRKNMDSEDWESVKNEASFSTHQGGRDAGAAARISKELLRDVRSIQLSMFGEVEHLQSNGDLVSLSENNQKTE